MTKHKKYRVANKARFTAFVAIMIIALAFIVTTALGFNTASGTSTQQYVQIEIQSGDPTFAMKSNKGRNVIYEICRLNGITAADLKAGQYITIPTEL